MQKIEPIEYGKYYHIFNKGINGTNLFLNQGNYLYFLELYKKYVSEIADTYAYCLLKNHFHFLVQIKNKDKILSRIPDRVLNPVRDERHKVELPSHPSKPFSNLFNAYAQAFNKQNNRTGSLFTRPFKRRLVDTKEYFKELIIYIHTNPIHHEFEDNISKYPWSSFVSYTSKNQTNLKKKIVIDWFGGLDNFKYVHSLKQEFIKIEKYIIE